MATVYDAAGGLDGLLRLAEAWHARVMADEVVSHAFSHGFQPDHTERLAAYWAEALGGPPLYTDVYGDETAVVRLHSGNGPHEEMDRRAVACFDQALVDVGLDDRTRAGAARLLRLGDHPRDGRYHESADEVPDGLPLPRWSWDGLSSHDRRFGAKGGHFWPVRAPNRRSPGRGRARSRVVKAAAAASTPASSSVATRSSSRPRVTARPRRANAGSTAPPVCSVGRVEPAVARPPGAAA